MRDSWNPLSCPSARLNRLQCAFFPFCASHIRARSDLLFSTSEWANFVVGAISPWISLDAKDPQLRLDSVAAL